MPTSRAAANLPLIHVSDKNKREVGSLPMWLCVALPVAAKELIGLGGAEGVSAHGVDSEERRSVNGDDDVGAHCWRTVY